MRLKHGISLQMRKRLQGIYIAKNRNRYKQFVVEAPQAVTELLQYCPEIIRDVFITEQVLETNTQIATLLHQHQVWTYMVSQDEIAELSKSTQGVLASANLPAENELNRIKSPLQLLVGTASVQDPGNLGTIIRCADAAGAQGVLVGQDSADIYAAKTIRATTGSIFHLPVVKIPLVEQVAFAKSQGIQVIFAQGSSTLTLEHIVLAMLGTDSINNSCGQLAMPSLLEPTLWVFGNEANGFSKTEEKLADYLVALPLYGKAESLNVSAAASACIYFSAIAQRQNQIKNT